MPGRTIGRMKVFAQILQYLPYVLAGVQAAEAAVGPGNGGVKRQLVLNAIDAAAKVGEQVPEVHTAAIGALIDSTVATLNQSNLLGFVKK